MHYASRCITVLMHQAHSTARMFAPFLLVFESSMCMPCANKNLIVHACTRLALASWFVHARANNNIKNSNAIICIPLSCYRNSYFSRWDFVKDIIFIIIFIVIVINIIIKKIKYFLARIFENANYLCDFMRCIT